VVSVRYKYSHLLLLLEELLVGNGLVKLVVQMKRHFSLKSTSKKQASQCKVHRKKLSTQLLN